MDGIVFFRTTDHDAVVDFYRDLGMEVAVEQPDCTILRRGDMWLRFCDRESAETDGIVTFVYETRAEVDAAHDRLQTARGPPRYNETYDIYQFFADDPEGRTVEFQTPP
jgi:catechol 2,3-dioxygenase-like lactoylglutathione lyase family enzyme